MLVKKRTKEWYTFMICSMAVYSIEIVNPQKWQQYHGGSILSQTTFTNYPSYKAGQATCRLYTLSAHVFIKRDNTIQKRSRYLRRLDTKRKTGSRSKSGPNTKAGRRYGSFFFLTLARVPDLCHFSSVRDEDGRLLLLLLFSETASWRVETRGEENGRA